MNVNKSFIQVGDVNQTRKEDKNKSLDQYLESLPKRSYLKGELSDILSYDSEMLAFVGRKAEISELQNFVNSERKVMWWAIVGRMGSGKRRLAYELQKRISSDWISRIVSWKVFYKYIGGVPYYDVRIEKNILIIIDDFRGEEENVAKWLMELYYTSLEHKIRILLISHNYEKINNSFVWEQSLYTSRQQLEILPKLKYKRFNLDIKDGRLTSDETFDLLRSYLKYGAGADFDLAIRAIQISVATELANEDIIVPGILVAMLYEYVKQNTTDDYKNIDKEIFMDEFNKELLEAQLQAGLKSNDEKEQINDIAFCTAIVGKVELDEAFEIFERVLKREKGYYESFKRKVRNSNLCLKKEGKYYFEVFSCKAFAESYIFQRLKEDINLVEVFLELQRYYYFEVHTTLNSLTYNYEKQMKELGVYERLQELEQYAIVKKDDTQWLIWNYSNNQFVPSEIIFTYQDIETKRNYMVYTDNIEDENGNIALGVSQFWEINGMIRMKKIESQHEEETFYRLIRNLEEASDEGDEEDC